MHDPTALIQRFQALHGYADAAVEQAARSDPGFMAAYLDMAAVALESGPLEPRMRSFAMIAANASVTHMNRDAVRHHVDAARRQGASDAELREVLQIASVLGIHGYMLGAPILLQEARKLAGRGADERPELGEREAVVREAFRQGRGYWSELLEDMLAASPEFFQAYTAFSSHPWKTGVLLPKQRELLYVAIDASTTHLHEAGTRIHTHNALRCGATPAEVIQVVQIVSCLGMQSYLLGMPCLAAA
ncbi:MAG: carboxymuconolactone decarboxylase family protein [Rubrivivax sp.]